MTPTGKVTHRIQLERDGTRQEWVLRDEPFAHQPNLRLAYERGFHQRTRDFDQGKRRPVAAAPAAVETVGDAYAHGYADARKQEARHDDDRPGIGAGHPGESVAAPTTSAQARRLRDQRRP